MGVLETLFGPDGPGGQPGAIGNVTNAIGLSGPGGLADSGKELAKGIASLPITLAKLPGDFARDPVAFFDDNGRPDLMAILLPSYRKQKVEAQKQAQEAYKLELKSKGVDLVKTIFGSALGEQRTGAGRQGYAQALQNDAPGLDVQPYLAATQAEQDAAMQAANDSGLLPSVAAIATGDDAARAGQSQFTDRLAREQNVQQAGLTRGNQSHASALAAGNISLRDRLARARAADVASGAVPPKTTGAERQGLKSVVSLKRLLRKGQVPEPLQAEARAAVKSKDGRLAYNVTAQMVGQQRTSSPKDVMNNPQYREAADRARAAQAAQQAVAAVEQAAFTPDGKGVDPTLFSPATAMFLPDNAAYQSVVLSTMGEEKGGRKQNLVSTAAKTVGDYVLRMTGKVSNVNELERLKTVAPTGNEASAHLFQTKVSAFNRALERDAQIAAEEAEAIGNGMIDGDWRATSLLGKYEQNLRQLNEELETIERDASNQPEGPLTPEEMAELEKYRANR